MLKFFQKLFGLDAKPTAQVYPKHFTENVGPDDAKVKLAATVIAYTFDRSAKIKMVLHVTGHEAIYISVPVEMQRILSVDTCVWLVVEKRP